MKRSQNIKQFFLASLLPIGMSIYPVMNSYAINVSILRINNLWGVLLVMALAALGIFLVTSFFFRENPFQAAIASTPFLILFLNYGSLYNALLNWDVLQIFHFNLLPVLVIISVYLVWAISRINIDLYKKIWLVLISVIELCYYSTSLLLSLLNIGNNSKQRELINVVISSSMLPQRKNTQISIG